MQKLKDRKPTHPEIVKGICQVLTKLHIFHYPNRAGLGTVKGLPDLTAIYKGLYVGIEVKSPRAKRVRPEQQAFIDRINAEGGIGIIAQSWWDVIKGLGLERRFR